MLNTSPSSARSEPPKPQWIFSQKEYIKCPRCKVGQLDRRIPRDAFVKYVLFWKDIKRYRCNNCWAKIYIRKKPAGKKKFSLL